MIINGSGDLQAQLTDDALVLRRKKDVRVLPYVTIEKVVHVPMTVLNPGEISPLLVGDTSRASSASADPNAIVVPRTGSKAVRANALQFASELTARVEAAMPKVQHSDLDTLRSDLKGFRRKQQIARTYAEKQEAEVVAQAKRDAADPAQAVARQQFEQDVARELETAARFAANGRIDQEHSRLHHVLGMAKAFGGRKAVAYAEQQIDHLRGQGRLMIGAARIGAVEPESRFEAVGRKETLGSLFTAKQPPIEVFSDRVIQGGSCKPIDEHTRAAVFLDGEQQMVSRNPFNSRKENTDDRRHAEFHVSGSGWSFEVTVHPDRLDSPRQLASQINIAADRLRAAAPVTVVPHESIRQETVIAVEETAIAAPSGGSIIDQLAKLQALRDAGAIDDQEFATLKGSLLSTVG